MGVNGRGIEGGRMEGRESVSSAASGGVVAGQVERERDRERERERLGQGSTHLQEGALGIPAFSLVSFPGAKEGEADLAVIIQIGVKAHTTMSSGDNVHQGWPVGIVGRKEAIKQEKSIFIRCPLRTTNDELDAV